MLRLVPWTWSRRMPRRCHLVTIKRSQLSFVQKALTLFTTTIKWRERSSMRTTSWLNLMPRSVCKTSLSTFAWRKRSRRSSSRIRLLLKRRPLRFSNKWENFKTWKISNTCACRWKTDKRRKNLRRETQSISTPKRTLVQKRARRSLKTLLRSMPSRNWEFVSSTSSRSSCLSLIENLKRRSKEPRTTKTSIPSLSTRTARRKPKSWKTSKTSKSH